MLDGRDLAVLSRRDDPASLTLSVFHTEDLDPRWSTELGLRDNAVLPLLLAREHWAVPSFQTLPDRRFRASLALIDKRGNVVQNIEGPAGLERPPTVFLSGGGIGIAAGNRIEWYR